MSVTKKITGIINGHVKLILDSNKELHNKRMKICRSCPLFLPGFINECNPALWINDKDEASPVKKDGYEKGCGCNLDAKTRLPEKHCPIKKW